MKVKYLGLFATFLVLVTAVQPICAAGNTGITISDQYGNYQSQFNFPCNTDESFNITLHCYGGGKSTLEWEWLDLDIYKLINDGSDANRLDISLYYHDCKKTNWNGIVTTPKIQFEPGDYVFIVTYEGSRRELTDPCMTKVKIHVS